jgi:AGCS family alanine or glycine:cation symporter
VAIISTGAWNSGESGVRITQQAFSTGLPGEWGGAIVAVCLAFFAFSTMLGWSYYGEKSLEYLAGSRTTIPYRVVFIVMIAVSAVAELDMVWLVSDILNALMALPNLIGLILLSGVVLRETRSYFQRNP